MMNENEKDIWERILNEGRKQLITEGWTPPQAKEPEPEFKPGDLVRSTEIESISIVSKVEEGKVYITSGGWLDADCCFHAPSWIKWETGDCPIERDKDVLVEFENGAKSWCSPAVDFSQAFVKRWAWMPGVE